MKKNMKHMVSIICIILQGKCNCMIFPLYNEYFVYNWLTNLSLLIRHLPSLKVNFVKWDTSLLIHITLDLVKLSYLQLIIYGIYHDR